jgi:hypothetical protein
MWVGLIFMNVFYHAISTGQKEEAIELARKILQV